MPEKPFDVSQIVAEQRQRQGLPPTVSEPAALRALARLIQIPDSEQPTHCWRCGSPATHYDAGFKPTCHLHAQ